MNIIKHILPAILLPACLQVSGQLPLPAIPAEYRQPAQRADYLSVHFYDAMDWDNAAMTTEENLMQDWANFLSVLPHCTPGGRDEAIVKTIHSIPASLVPKYVELADGYLFAVDSELCDEATYLKVLSALVSHPAIEQGYKSALESRLEYLSHCAPGVEAADIDVTELFEGTTCRLSGLRGKAKQILVVFFDPDCEDCHEALETLSIAPEWKARVDAGDLLIVKSMITDDTDMLYPILTVPSFYLIDGATLAVTVRNLPLEKISYYFK